MPTSPDDLDGLKAERAAAERAYNEALARLDAAYRQSSASLPRPPAGVGLRGLLGRVVRRAVPGLREQQTFSEQIADQIALMVQFQSLLVVYLQQITPFVDTRDRDVAGLLRGLSGAISAVSDELLKRSEAMLARDRRRELQLDDLAVELAGLRARFDELRHTLAGSVGAKGRPDVT